MPRREPGLIHREGMMATTIAKKRLQMHRIYFSKTEQRICTGIGKLRHEVTSAHGTERKQDQRKDGLQMSIDGVLTEYAVAKALNLHFNLDCDFRKFEADLVFHNGLTIDVKSTKPGGNLNAVRWSNGKDADYYVLTEIHHNFVGIVGYLERNLFLIDANLRDVGNGQFYSVPQRALFSIENLLTNSTHIF